MSTPDGAVRGAAGGSGLVFRAIPYAAAPTGSQRFRPPQAPHHWSGVRDATSPGPTALQPPARTGGIADLIPNISLPGEDYLHLDVWTPDTGGSAPVIVFIHGGAFVSGSNALTGYTADRFARDGIVTVVINYRLGADGFGLFPGVTPNLGLLDQIAALRWVRDRIAAFGGDPGNVTVMGESAGAMSIGALLGTPAARGLFRRAILESGACHHTLTAETARKVGVRLAAILGVPATPEGIAGVEPERLSAAQARLSAELLRRPSKRRWAELLRNLMPFEPVVDGEILPRDPLEAVREGSAADVEILAGHNLEEGRLFLLGLPENGIGTRIAGRLIARNFGLGAAGLRTYRRTARAGTDLDVTAAVLTDAVYRIPALRLAEAHGRTHLYRFGWRSPAMDGRLGAAHAVELPFVFDNLDEPDWAGILQGRRPQELAGEMHAAWVAFARTGDPGWPRYDPVQRTEREFGTGTALVHDVDARRRLVWAGVR